MVERNNYPKRRTKRAHGVRKQDAAAMAQFEYEQKQRPAVPSGEPVYIRVACRCAPQLTPHFHGPEELERWKRDASKRMPQ